jgi:2-keto-4-pentenoate hydratase/2-oxohepta-3-ene-1,7-dioic acid hydratase in catechol pathway
MSHVFGYTCFNDGSIRDIQFKHSIAAGKNFHATIFLVSGSSPAKWVNINGSPV